MMKRRRSVHVEQVNVLLLLVYVVAWNTIDDSSTTTTIAHTNNPRIVGATEPSLSSSSSSSFDNKKNKYKQNERNVFHIPYYQKQLQSKSTIVEKQQIQTEHSKNKQSSILRLLEPLLISTIWKQYYSRNITNKDNEKDTCKSMNPPFKMETKSTRSDSNKVHMIKWHRRRRQKMNDDKDECNPNMYSSLIPIGLVQTGTSRILQTILSSLMIVGSKIKNQLSSIDNIERLVRSSLTFIEAGIVIFIGHIVWKTVSEIIDEVNDSSGTVTTDSTTSTDDHDSLLSNRRKFGRYSPSLLVPSSDPLLVTDPKEVERVLTYIEIQKQQHQQQQQQSQRLATELPSQYLLQIANKLVSSGMPLRTCRSNASIEPNSSDESGDGNKQSNDNYYDHYQPSVETLLLQLTRLEASILQQSLSASASPVTSSDTSDQNKILWDSISGLKPIKQGLYGTISMLVPSTNNYKVINNDNSIQEHHQHEQHQNLLQSYRYLFHNSNPRPQLIVDTNTGTDYDTNTVRQMIHNFQPTTSTTSVTGILLYGPPGCGKTLLVKSLASIVQLPCLVVSPSLLLRKYVGETNQHVRALFSLLNKLAPCIVCIDELDGLFRERNDNEHEVSRDLKTEFVQWWDGLMSSTVTTTTSTSSTTTTTTTSTIQSQSRPIIVIGATNRPFDVDAAVLRRLPQSYYVGLPDTNDRIDIIQRLLQPPIPIDPSINIQSIAKQTEGYSPSDIRQVIQTAVLSGPMQRYSTVNKLQRSKTSSSSNRYSDSMDEYRLTTDDILHAVDLVPPTPLSQQYRTQLENFARRPTGSSSSSSSTRSTIHEISSPSAISTDEISIDPSRQETVQSSSSNPINNNEHNADRVPNTTTTTTTTGREDHHHQQHLSPIHDRSTSLQYWETKMGNYYNIGTLVLDETTFNTLTDILEHFQDKHQGDNDDD